jgi:hypothetical protein
MSEIHDLINDVRMQNGIPWICWSNNMAHLAESQAEYCARIGRLVHSSRFAFWGGENLMQGHWRSSPWDVVNCWMNSKAGHREYLLSPRVKKAGVGVAYANGQIYVAWAFSDKPPSFADCPRELCPHFFVGANRRGKRVERCNAERAVSEKEAKRIEEEEQCLFPLLLHNPDFPMF